MLLIKLFLEFLKIGAFSFGGGLATLPHIYDLAEKTAWFSERDVTNMITVSQITPGPLACNVATYVGVSIGGILGGLVANIAFVIPAIIFMGIVYKILDKFKNNEKVEFTLSLMRAAAFATVIYGSLSIFKIAFLGEKFGFDLLSILTNLRYKTIILAILLYIFLKKVKIPILYIMIFSAIIGVIFQF